VLKERRGMPAGIQALEAVGTVTAADYERVFAPVVAEVRRAGSRLRLLYEFGPAFQRITAGALWADARLGLNYVQLLDGCAVVSDVGWVRAPSRAIGTWMPLPVRVYHNNERDDAIAWLSSLSECAGVAGHDVAKAYIGGVGATFGSVGALALSRILRTVTRRPHPSPKSQVPEDRPRPG
jgi:SpoIIAA-like